ncbi:Ig-like domain-containing protein [Caenorhabditis elegans]|uniref:Ig-like domain-containing protein n=1 Tax=Caenorhabditis elegans TaxID=6239 RepID=Q9GYM2_CAEEL|nr:Ig-like domain-containing protein [Caenorhabditis elegans]CCD70301.1 Ig-like domain-containing protein [Caenorhabditis elegans]|eukprot:NP_494730.1 Uncharacterized protein CELE_R03H10.4 [Caenorhabditis elegans]
MKSIVFFVVLFGSIYCEGCHVQIRCPCPDMLETLVQFPVATLYSEGAGCTRNVTCTADKYQSLSFMWSETEIPRPDKADEYPLALTPQPRTGEYVDMFSYFGVVCEDDGWYATQYPNGVTYEYESEYHTIESSEVNGKKSKILFITW